MERSDESYIGPLTTGEQAEFVQGFKIGGSARYADNADRGKTGPLQDGEYQLMFSRNFRIASGRIAAIWENVASSLLKTARRVKAESAPAALTVKLHKIQGGAEITMIQGFTVGSEVFYTESKELLEDNKMFKLAAPIDGYDRFTVENGRIKERFIYAINLAQAVIEKRERLKTPMQKARTLAEAREIAKQKSEESRIRVMRNKY